jgi:DNA-binding transcriptional ArsR family regulator
VLTTTTITRALPAAVQAYLHEALGADVRIRPWNGTRKLPYVLQDAFDVHELELRDRKLLLASARNGRIPALSALRTQLDKLAHIAEQQVIFAAATLASYERKRLVQQKMPFVVPGNQLYLPDLGIDFREYYRRPPAARKAFSPATQAMFIAVLMRQKWQGQWLPAEVSTELGYTAMTLSRAIRELTGAGLVTAHQEGRVRRIRMKDPPRQAWEHARPFLRSPVKRTVWVRNGMAAGSARLPLAGLSALALYSMLTEPPWPIHAASAAQWKAAQRAGIESLAHSEPDASQWQVWTYAPHLLADTGAVDPLSLTLSLQDEQDERVQKALEELRGRFPW